MRIKKEPDIIFRKKIYNKSIRDLFYSLIDTITLGNLERLSHKHISENRRQLVVLAFDWIGFNVNIQGVYEKDYLDIVFAWLSRYSSTLHSSTAIDIGANIGNHSLYFSDHFSSVISFEPNTRIYKVLCINAELASNIRCFNQGLSNNTGNANLHIVSANTGGSSLIKSSKSDKTIEVYLTRLDDHVELQDKITLIKIDAEGWEQQILEGAEQTIKKNYPVILFEQKSSDFTDGTTNCIELLKHFGYTRFASIDKVPRFPKNLPKGIGKIVHQVEKRITGAHFVIAIHDRFEKKNYKFLIAIPEWLI